jgi:hypothetical protein
MRPIFIAFVVTACLLLGVTAVIGARVEGLRWFDYHFAFGLVATLVLCFVHTVVFAYFMATSKMMKLAVEDAELDSQLFERARACKARAFRTIMPAIMMVLAGAFTGAWTTDRPEHHVVHLAAVVISAAVQCAAWRVEYGLITDNGRLMDEVFKRHAARGMTHEVRNLQ